MSITQERLKVIRAKADMPQSSFLARSIAKSGISPIKDDPNMLKEYLGTKYTIDTGKGTNQASSGRCWIYSALNWMRTLRLKDYGKDFEYSQNYVAFWDKFERANHFLETMCKLSEQDASSQEVQSVLTRVFTDGGEWELFENVVAKYGLVPRYAMPETGFSGNSGGYMDILKKRLRVGGGLLHKKLRAGGTAAATEVEAMKVQILSEVYRILVCYLGEPPSDFLWQQQPTKEAPVAAATSVESTGTSLVPDTSATAADPSTSTSTGSVPGLTVSENRAYVTLTPLQFLEQSQFSLGEKVHLSHLPHHPESSKLVARAVTNVTGAKHLQAYNVSVPALKAATRASIRAGHPVEISCEMRHHDRNKTLLSDDNDLTAKIFDLDTEITLNKGDELVYQVTSVAHGMVLIGCDDDIPPPSASAAGKEEGSGSATWPPHMPLGPLWKVENSWKDMQYLYMTDKWFEANCYGIVVDKQFLSDEVLAIIENCDNGALPTIVLPTSDPFCKI